jgi:trimeric autotransporter adhesin
MLGTQTQYPNQYSTEAAHTKGRSWRKPAIVVVLLALVGIGGWWMYQNSTAGQGQTAPGQMTNISAPAAAGQLPGSSTTAGESAVARTASAGTAASTASASAGRGAVQATKSIDQTADQGLKLASLAGVAEVGGTRVWSDEGTLLATLDSGSLLTVKARTGDGTWLAVTTDAGSGWAQTSSAIAYGLQNLVTTVVPAAVASASAQAGGVAEAATTAAASAADPSATGASLALADLVPTSSTGGAQLAQAAAAQLTAKIAATGSRLNVRSGPGISYQVVAKAGDGTEYQAVGRSAAGDWLLLQLSADIGDIGWVSAGYVELNGDIQALPVENV